MSIAENARRQLEAIGDYVTRANVDWFAIFPEKLSELKQIAAANGRESYLVVYRTRSKNDRDHHAIPLSELADLLLDQTLTHSHVNGTIRWNVTLKDHIIRVSHSDASVSVEKYFQVPLAIELTPIPQQLERPIDFTSPYRVPATTYRILRDTAIARQIKQAHNHCCQICGVTIELPDGTRYAEAHHIRPLGRPHDGPDVAENMIVLCPNHHAMCDYGAIPLSTDSIRQIDSHRVNQSFINYHNDRVFRQLSPGKRKRITSSVEAPAQPVRG